MSANTVLNISSGPHVRSGWTTRKIMFTVAATLVPAAAVGVYVYGLQALWVILTCVLSAVATEFIFDALTNRPNTWTDGSAVVTGLMLALTLSPTVPLYIPILGSVFAIGVVKCCFGGLGKNFINPALAARCFLLISFTDEMTTYTVDGASAATPLANLVAGKAVNVTNMFLGTTNGVIGSCVLALLIGGLILWALDIIHGQICFSVLIGFTLFVGFFGGQGFDPAFLAAHLCGGGVVLGAFFMATDYVTSPVSRLGQTVYGVLIGVLGAMFRVFGGSADSFSYAIIIGNLLTPLIDTYIVSKPYAFRRKAVRVQNGEPKKTVRDVLPKPVVVLTVIALISGLVLSGSFRVTKDTIAEQDRAKAAAAYKSVLPDAETFTFLDEKTAPFAGKTYGSGFGNARINEAVEGLDASGNVIGYGISASSMEGYNGEVTLTVGVTPDGKITNIAYTVLKETPGKGMLWEEAAYKSRFNGKPATKLELDGGGETGVDGISGVTITSKATVNAVNAALDFYNNVIKEAAE